ncbi:hypothetical protein BC938DRAFT_477003, partial [Jimgerdemannia flammicorona]
ENHLRTQSYSSALISLSLHFNTLFTFSSLALATRTMAISYTVNDAFGTRYGVALDINACGISGIDPAVAVNPSRRSLLRPRWNRSDWPRLQCQIHHRGLATRKYICHVQKHSSQVRTEGKEWQEGQEWNQVELYLGLAGIKPTNHRKELDVASPIFIYFQKN